MFVVAWLIALYVYEVVQEVAHGAMGFLAAVLTFGVNLYARKRAVGCAPGSRSFKFWLYLPAAVFLVLPVLIKVVIYFASEGDRSWWDHLLSLLPFVLKLGVPVMTLLCVYIALGRLGHDRGGSVETVE